MTTQNYITEQNYDAFKKAYATAVSEGRTVFDFEGQQVLVSYAKYVCEYVEGRMTRESEVQHG